MSKSKEYDFSDVSDVKRFMSPEFDQSQVLGGGPGFAIQKPVVMAFGFKEAAVLQTLHNRLIEMEHSPGEFSENFYRNRFWVDKTFEEWASEMPHVGSLRTHKKIMNHFREIGIIESGQFGERFDRTNWYTINYLKLGEFLYGTMDK